MERNLFKYVWRHSKNDQLRILFIVLISQVFYYISLDIPKTIINKAIQGGAFEKLKVAEKIPADATVPVFSFSFDWPEFLNFMGLSGHVSLFSGFNVNQVQYLITFCFLFLAFVLINNSMKSKINTEKGRLGERMLRRLRFELFDRILRFPAQYFRKVKPAETATMIKDEVEPLGGFIGDAFVSPAYSGGLALTALFFIISQNIYLGLLAVGTLVVQFSVIPRLRKRLLVLGKQRQLTARELAGRIAECVDGAHDIQVNGTSSYERADIVSRLARIFDIRFELYKRKFTVKALNNFLNQFTPFMFYLIGGYLAIKGTLDVGTVVAAIGAYKDLPSPIKELIDWDQTRQDVQIKYEQVVDQFTVPGLADPGLHDIAAPSETLQGALNLSSVSADIEGEGKVLDSISVELMTDRHTAIIGPSGGGKEYLSLLIARLLSPTAGAIRFGGRDLMSLPAATLSRVLAYIGQEPYIFPLSIRDNVLYGLRQRPRTSNPADGLSERDIAEAERTGNPPLNIKVDWTDYEAAGATGPQDIDDRILEVLRQIELEDDIYQFGLRGRIDPQAQPELAQKLVSSRGILLSHLKQHGLAQLVESFDRDRYNRNMSVAENLLFGTPIGPAFDGATLFDNAYLNTVLAETGLDQDLFQMGKKIAETMIELFADLPAGHPFFDQFSFIAADDLPEYRALLGRLDKAGTENIRVSDHRRLMSLAFPYIESRHRLDLVNADMEEKILSARRAFADGLPEDLQGAIEFYDTSRYNANASLQDNILFGRLVYGQSQAEQKIGAAIASVIETAGLRQAVLGVGLDYPAGTAGKRLTAMQRQKIGLARALIKRPQLLIINQATAIFDNATQLRLMNNILKSSTGRGILWVLHRPDVAQYFSRVLVMENGRLVEQGSYDDLNRPGTAYHALAAAAA